MRTKKAIYAHAELSAAERRKLLRKFDRLMAAIPERPAAEVDAELAELRTARLAGAKRSASSPAR
jgi:hypothetical protein